MMKTNLAISILLAIWSIHASYTGTSLSKLNLIFNSEQKEILELHTHLENGLYKLQSLDVSQKHIQLLGSSNTVIVQEKTDKLALFFGKQALITLHKLRFPVKDGLLIANIERLSQMTFKDNILVGNIIMRNCFLVDGGELIITRLKLEFENTDERKIMNFIQFSEVGGNLRVLKTNIERVMVIGANPLFGNQHANQISLIKCIFTDIITGDNDFNISDNFIGATNVSITSCTFIDVENVLIGGVVSGLNQNGKLLVKGSTFKSCINTQQTIRQNKDRTEIISGDAQFEDDKFEECSSLSYGGAISFISDGELIIKDCKFYNNSAKKGGAIYALGSGKHNLKDSRFENCVINDYDSVEGGSVYLEMGLNYIKELTILNSKAEIKLQSAEETTQSVSRGGAIFIHDWLKDSYIKDAKITNSEAGYGGAIYISQSASDSGRLKITDVTLRNNIANRGGGGAIYSTNATLIYIADAHFSSNEATGPYQGKDVHLGDLGVSSDNIKLEKLQRDIVMGCRSNTTEPRICIENYLCPNWIEDELNMPVWAIIVVSLFVISLIVTVIIIIICCVFKRKQKNKTNDNMLQLETNKKYAIGAGNQNIQGAQQIQGQPNIQTNQSNIAQNTGQINQNVHPAYSTYQFSAPPPIPVPQSLPQQRSDLIYNPPPPDIQDQQDQDKDNLLE